jgi:hypothetical protein
LRLPQIEQFTPTGEASDNKHGYTLTGRNLEMIEKAGWDQLSFVDVTDLPVPIPGEGQKQTLHVMLPDEGAPSPTLYVWLRGEKTGRSTTITPAAPASH